MLTYAEKFRFAIIIFVLICLSIFIPLGKFNIAYKLYILAFLLSAGLIFIGLIYRFSNRSFRISATLVAFSQYILFLPLGVTLSYVFFQFDRQSIDASLASWDMVFGLDWFAFVDFVKMRDILHKVLMYAYALTMFEIAPVVLILGFTNRVRRLDIFTCALMIGAMAAIAIWAVYPSFGAIYHYDQLGIEGLVEISFIDRDYLDHMSAAMAGTIKTLEPGKMYGVIAFPSFHTITAICCAYAMWGVRGLGPVFLILNVLVICSVPIDGGHHFVDIAGGLAIAIAAIKIAAYILEAHPGGKLADIALENGTT